MSWAFFEYVNQRGEGAVAEWLRSLPIGIQEDVKAALDAQLQLIQPLMPLRRPYAGKLENKHGAHCAGLYELRFSAVENTIECRPLFCYQPGRRVVILAGAEERGRKLIPTGICVIAHGREAQLDQPGRSRSYDYK
jgi:hypothetical protein